MVKINTFNVIAFWILICINFSCNKKTGVIDPADQHRYDSLLSIEGDKVLDNINFGISPTQYEADIKKFIEVHTNYRGNLNIMGSEYSVLYKCYEPKRFYGKGSYSESKFLNLCSLKEFNEYENSSDVHYKTSTMFCNGKLFSFNLETSGESLTSAKDIDMTYCISGLKSLFESMYGKSTSNIFKDKIDWNRVAPNEIYPLIEWNMGAKSVIVYVRASNPAGGKIVYAGATITSNQIYQKEKAYSSKNNVSSATESSVAIESRRSEPEESLSSMEYNVESESFAAVNKESFNMLNKVCNNKDQATLLNMISNNLVYILPANLKVRLIDGGIATSKIKLLEGDNRGLELYISSEFIKK